MLLGCCRAASYMQFQYMHVHVFMWTFSPNWEETLYQDVVPTFLQGITFWCYV